MTTDDKPKREHKEFADLTKSALIAKPFEGQMPPVPGAPKKKE